MVEVCLRVPVADGRLLAFLAENARVIERELDDEHWKITARLAPWHASKIPAEAAVSGSRTTGIRTR